MDFFFSLFNGGSNKTVNAPPKSELLRAEEGQTTTMMTTTQTTAATITASAAAAPSSSSIQHPKTPISLKMTDNSGTESKDPSDEEMQQQSYFVNQPNAGDSDHNNDDNNDDDNERTLFRREIVYQDPYPDFYDDCFEYFIISPTEYGLRRVGSKRIHYLVRETSFVFHWCVELERSVVHEQKMQTLIPQTNNDDALKHAQEIRNTTSIVDDRVPGVMGVFVEQVLECEAQFAFSRLDKKVKIVNCNTSTTPPAAVPPKRSSIFNQDHYIAKAGTQLTITRAMNSNAVPLMANDYLASVRIDTLSDIMCGQKRMSEYYDIDRDISRWHLKRFERFGETGRRAEVASPTQLPFTSTVSPVTPTNGRWYVISAYHWALYAAWKRVHERSGALLYRLPELLASSESGNVGVLQLMGAGQADQDIPIEHQRRIIRRMLEFEKQESESERATHSLQAQLQHEAERLVAMKADLSRVKVEKQNVLDKLRIVETGESILQAFTTRLDSISEKISRLKAQERNRLEKKE